MDDQIAVGFCFSSERLSVYRSTQRDEGRNEISQTHVFVGVENFIFQFILTSSSKVNGWFLSSSFSLCNDENDKCKLLNATLMTSLQVLQNKAAKIILDRPLYSSATRALATPKWVPLEKRRFQRRCIYVYKYLNRLVGHNMNFRRQHEQHDYNTRTKLNFRLPSVKRNWGKQRTAFHAFKDFNSLSQATRQSADLNIFKRNLLNLTKWILHHAIIESVIQTILTNVLFPFILFYILSILIVRIIFCILYFFFPEILFENHILYEKVISIKIIIITS